MADIKFEELQFEEKDGKITVSFLEHFYFEADAEILKKAGMGSAEGNTISFPALTEKEARARLMPIIDAGFEELKSKTTGNKTIYVNKYLGLPLIGSSSFGIVDRNSSMLEIKPITGEPTLYTPMPELIKGLREIKQVKTISLITNATMLTESYIDKLAAAGLTRLNISLNAASEKMAKILEGHGKYDVKKAKQMAEYAAGKMEVIIAPVFVPGYNDTELGEIIKFTKSIGAKAGIQNYLFYKKGRNPKNASQMPWEKFYEMLKKLEKEHEFKLMLDEKDFQITKTKPLKEKSCVEGSLASIRSPKKAPGKTMPLTNCMTRNSLTVFGFPA